jgi:predicted porin
MKRLGMTAASAAALMLSGAGGAYAADLGPYPVKAVPVASTTCTSILDFFTTACQLSAYGVRFYGTVDVGYGYQTHGTPMDKTIGADYMLGKPSRNAMWVLSPNALSVSNVGFQIKEPLGAGWSFVGQLETGFNPFSMDILDSPKSLRTGIGTPLGFQNAITDANFNGQFYSDLGFAGFSHDTWGTLTYGRQNSLGADQVLSYDPQQSAGGFSPLGLIGSWAGGGNTENRRDTSALKYRVNFANYHFGAYASIGGYEMGNADTQAYSGNVGGDWHVGPGNLSADVTASWRQNSIGEGPGGILGPADINGIPVNPFTQGTGETISASLNNTTQVMVTAKYEVDRLKLFAGWNLNSFSAPDNPNPGCISDISGLPLGCTSAASFNPSVLNGRIFQIAWVGARYAVTDSLDVSAAYYHAWQNDFSAGASEKYSTATSSTTSALHSGDPNATCALHPTISIQCKATQDVVSAVVDWKFAPKWDTYIGTEYTHQDGGLVAGYLNNNNWSTTGGLRFRW